MLLPALLLVLLLLGCGCGWTCSLCCAGATISLFVFCLAVAGHAGALKKCQNQEWPSEAFSESPLSCGLCAQSTRTYMCRVMSVCSMTNPLHLYRSSLECISRVAGGLPSVRSAAFCGTKSTRPPRDRSHRDMPNLVRVRARPTQKLVVLKLPLHQRTAGASHNPQNQEWPFPKVSLSGEIRSWLLTARPAKNHSKSSQNGFGPQIFLRLRRAYKGAARSLRRCAQPSTS